MITLSGPGRAVVRQQGRDGCHCATALRIRRAGRTAWENAFLLRWSHICQGGQGGHLLVTAFSDVVDESDRFREGGYLTQLGRTLGIWLEDFGSLALPGGLGQAHAPFAGPFGHAGGSMLAEEIHLGGAEELGTYVGGRLDGRPAFTANRVGSGAAYYLSTVPDAAGTDAVLGVVLDAAGSNRPCRRCLLRSRLPAVGTC